MSLQIRTAVLSDVDVLKGYQSRLVEHERSTEPTLKQEGILEYYDIPQLIEDTRSTLVLVAEIDGQPAGCGFGQIRKNDPFYQVEQYGYIGLMYVDERFRGNNVGRAIIEALKVWFQQKAIREIHLKVYASNPGAIKAYEKIGFSPYVHEMKLDLDTPE